MLKEMKKHEDKEQGNTLTHEAPRSINHNATQNKNNTGTIALERSVAQIFFTVDKLHPGSRCNYTNIHKKFGGARWLRSRVSDSGAGGPGFETYRRRVVSLSKTLYSPKVLVNYPGSGGSVPTRLKNC